MVSDGLALKPRRSTPFELGRRGVRIVGSFWTNIRLPLFIEVQAKASTFTLWILIGYGQIWWAALVNIVWSLVFCHWYENRQQEGMEDLTENKTSRDAGGWVAKIIRYYFLGAREVIYIGIFRRICGITKPNLLQKALKKFWLGVGLFVFGVITSHALLKASGWDERNTYRGNLAGRFLNVIYRVIEGVAIVFVIRYFWMLFHTSNEMVSVIYNTV